MAQRQDSYFSLSRRSTGFFERNTEELPIVPLGTPRIINHVEAANQLSARLLDYTASVDAAAEPPVIYSVTATRAWKVHLSKLSFRERDFFKRHGKADLSQYISEIEDICRKQKEESRGLKIAKLFYPWFSIADLYAPVAKTMIQADPSSSALVLGGIMCIMSINQRYAEFPEHIMDMLAYMGEKADILTAYSSAVYQNNDSVQTAVVEVFADILEFCKLAIPLFITEDGKKRGTMYTLAKSFVTSYNGYFGKIITKFKQDLELFEDKARLCDRLENKGMQREMKNYQALQVEASRYQLVGTMQLGAQQQSFHQTQMSALASSYYLMAFHHSSWEASEALRRKQEADREKEIQRNKIIAWLEKSSIKFHEDQNKKVRHRVEGTGTWILKHDRYITWKESSEAQLLWVHGKRGCGKSFLTSIVVQDLKAMCESDGNMKKNAKEKYAFAFVYCDSRETDKYDLEKLLCSLTKQLCDQLPIPATDPYLEGIYKRYGDARPLDLEEIQKALESLIGQFKQTYLVIDGLDELRVLGIDSFSKQCQHFRNLAQPREDGSTVKLIAFSRPEYLNIERCFASCPQVRIDDGSNDADIKKFIGEKIASIQLYFEHNPALITETTQSLLDQAQGMFLWVDRAINTLQDERNAKGLRQKLKDLPRDLDVEYATSLAKIAKKGGMALKALLWITNAKRPLKHRELLEVLAVSPDMIEITPDEMISEKTDFCAECDNLVDFDRDKKTYQLTHSSIKDYLTDERHVKGEMLQDYRDLQRNADKILGETCLTYLSFKQFGKGVPSDIDGLAQLILINPFLEYALIYWGTHVASARDDHLCNLARSFVMVSERRDLSMALIILAKEERPKLFSGPSNPLHILAMFDLVDLTENIKDLDAYRTQADGFEALPLDYALSYGNRDICNKLLPEFVNADRGTEKPACRCLPIHAAAHQGWDEVVRKLLDLEYDAEIGYGDEELTAFHISAIQGSTDVLEVLLEKHINMNARDIDGSTPLLRACEADNVAFAKRLIEADADVTLAGWNGTTPLHHAAKNGRLGLVQMILQKGPGINATCTEKWGFRTPLHLAVEENAHKVVQYLLEQEAEVDRIGPEGFTALHLSATQADTKCLEALLRFDARTDLRTDDGRNVIHIAAANGHKAVLEFLVQARPSEFANLVGMTDNDNDTALHWAVYNERLETAKYLMDHGASCETSNSSLQSPFHAAFGTGNVEMIKMFFKKTPACITSKGGAGSTVLHYLAHHGAEYPALNELVPTFLAADVDPEAQNGVGQRAIHLAMAVGNLQFADILFDNTPKLDLWAVTTSRRAPMHVAADEGKVNSVEWLLNNGVSLQHQEKDDSDNYPIHNSAWNGHTEVLQKLLSPEKVNEPGFKGRTALYGASARGHYDTVKCLLESGADPNIADDLKNTPLIVSIQQKHARVAHLLLERNADPHLDSVERRTALHEAVVMGDETLVRRLLSFETNPLHANKFGQTPFTFALVCENPEILRILVEEVGIDGWQQCNSWGDTCFHALASFGDKARFEKYEGFLPLKAVNITDEVGRNALCHAAMNGHTHLFSYLLGLGVQIQGTEESTKGPLHEAAENGFTDSVVALVNLRRDQVAIDERRGLEGRTALHLAVLSNRPLTAKILLEAGADPSLRDYLGLNCYDFALDYPSLWKETSLWQAKNTRSALAPRMLQLRQTAQRLLKIILDQPEVLDSLGEYYRSDSLRVLGQILFEIGTEVAIERAVICYIELGTPSNQSFYQMTWTCTVCGKGNFGGSKWMFPQSAVPVLCNTCFCDHKATDGSLGSVKSSVKTLESLEDDLVSVRRALVPFVDRGSRFIANACGLLVPSKRYLDRKREEYEAWEKAYNNNAKFDKQRLIGLRFLELLKKAEKVLEEPHDDDDVLKNQKSQASNEKNLTVPDVSQNLNLRGDQVRDTFKTLDQAFFVLFKDNRPDKELRRTLFSEKYPVEIPELDKANETQKKCFGESQRIQRGWLLELREWFDKLEPMAVDTKLTSSDQSEIRSDNPAAAIVVSEHGLSDENDSGTLRRSTSAFRENLLPQAENAGGGARANESDETGKDSALNPTPTTLERRLQASINQYFDTFTAAGRALVVSCFEDLMELSTPEGTQKLSSLLEYLRNSQASKFSAHTELMNDQTEKGKESYISVSTEVPGSVTAGINHSLPPDHLVNENGPDTASVSKFDQQRARIISLHEASWRIAQAIVFDDIDQATISEMLLEILKKQIESSTETEAVASMTNDNKNPTSEAEASAADTNVDPSGIVKDGGDDSTKTMGKVPDGQKDEISKSLETE